MREKNWHYDTALLFQPELTIKGVGIGTKRGGKGRERDLTLTDLQRS